MIDAADAIANVKLTLIFSIFKTLDDLHLKALAITFLNQFAVKVVASSGRFLVLFHITPLNPCNYRGFLILQ